jgi:hypothetical protein
VHNQKGCSVHYSSFCSSRTAVATTMTWRIETPQDLVTLTKVVCRLFGCAQQQDEQTVPMDVCLSQGRGIS